MADSAADCQDPSKNSWYSDRLRQVSNGEAPLTLSDQNVRSDVGSLVAKTLRQLETSLELAPVGRTLKACAGLLQVFDLSSLIPFV